MSLENTEEIRILEQQELASVTDPVSLDLLSWNVAGLSEDSTDIFMSQISMLTDWHVLLLQECFRKLRTLGRTAMSSSHREPETERTIKSC